MEKEKQLSPGEQKVLEYVERIQAGQSREEIFQGLPDSFRHSIEEKLNGNANEEVIEKKIGIPSQYEGLPAEIVEELWSIPMYVDAEKTKQENEKKRQAIELLRQKEKMQVERDEIKTQDREKLEEIRGEMGTSIAFKQEGAEVNSFNSFKMNRGDTIEGMWWYEWRNQAIKDMKEDGKFEWGKERIYFDIPLVDMIRLRDLALMVAAEEKIPIAFKHLDEEKTFSRIKDGTETRFVANFASEEDALKFYMAIKSRPEYQSFHSDRNMSYGGYRADEIAEYANGYRENRDALQRIMNGAFNKQGLWEWVVDGNKKAITNDEYEVFKKKLEEFNLKISNAQQQWEDALKRGIV